MTSISENLISGLHCIFSCNMYDEVGSVIILKLLKYSLNFFYNKINVTNKIILSFFKAVTCLKQAKFSDTFLTLSGAVSQKKNTKF